MIGLRAWPAAMVFVLAGCHRPKTTASVVNMADPATADQLTGGFYQVEANAWRWAGPRFSLVLAPPPNAPRGARLVLQLYIPETQLHEIGPMTLSAFVDGQGLPPETFSKGGSYVFVRDIPACMLKTNLLPFNFNFNTFIHISETQQRELAAVISMAALEAK